MEPTAPRMYELYAAFDVIERATNAQYEQACDNLIKDSRTARTRALNAYKGSKVQKAQRKPKPTGEGWDPEHQIIVTLSARKGKKGSK